MRSGFFQPPCGLRSARQMSSSALRREPLLPVEMNHVVLPSGENHGSASIPGPASCIAFGADHFPAVHWELKMRHPEKVWSLRTNQKSPLIGSIAGWDSHMELEI